MNLGPERILSFLLFCGIGAKGQSRKGKSQKQQKTVKNRLISSKNGPI